ncbi:MAG: methyltransferase [Magnetovibrio sp.]|nr:methyltransferase [Magnetovibrio sp.]
MTNTTQDFVLNGKVTLHQYKEGYRMAVDTVLLAASVRGSTGGRALDMGCGVGGAMLCLAYRCPELGIDGLELQPHLAQLAAKNIHANGFEGRLRVFEGDIQKPPAEIEPESYTHVFANPPFMQDDRGHHPPDQSKRLAHVESHTNLADWVQAALGFCKRKGSITIIQRADRLDELMAALGRDVGEVTIFPIWPKAGENANRVIVRARKGIKTPMRLTNGMTLHNADGSYTALADEVLNGGGLYLRET